MAILSINKKLFEKEIGKLDEKMQERIMMLGTEIEKITEQEIELEITPDRPDLLSYQGFKRALLAFLGKKTGLKQYKLNKPLKEYKLKIDSSLKNIRPHTACAIVKDLKFDNEKIKEIIDIQEKLHLTVGRKRKKLAIGIYPLEKITLPITFKALEPDKIKFIPLESDKEMSGLQILQRHPAGRDYAHLLAGKTKFPIFTDSADNILSMPPIINSQLTGKITEHTKDIFIECSGFDIEILKKCLNIIITSLADMGGQVYQMQLDYGNKKITTPDLKSEKMKISLENTNKLLGLSLKENQIKQFLEKMTYNYESKTKQAEIPPWRADILHEVDLIEDVAIAYGYENFTPEIPEISTIGQKEPKEIIKEKISDILTGLNMMETSNYHLTTKRDQFEKMNAPEKQSKTSLEVEESKTEYTALRENLAHYLLKTLSENIDAEYPQKIFEIGRIFNLDAKTNNILEHEHLALAITPGNFTEAKQILEYLLKMLDLDKKVILKEPEETPSYYIDGRTAEITLNNKSLGYLGEIHPKILRNWKIKMPVALFEISLEELFNLLL